ncbi:hypothetical protein CR513_23445, partial [Mucuna pruriens]
MVNICKILDKNNRARVMPYKMWTLRRTRSLARTAIATRRLRQANWLVMVVEKNYKKSRCIRENPNPNRELNSKDQSLRANQVKKFLRKDVQVYVMLVSLKIETEVVVIDLCSLPSENGVLLFINLVPYIRPLPHHCIGCYPYN